MAQFGVVSVAKKHCSTSLVKEVELHAHIPQESKLGVTPQLKRKVTVNFPTTTSGLAKIVTATMFSPVYETSNGVPENRTMSFSYFPMSQLTRKTTINFQTKDKKRVFIAGCDILPDGKLLFIDQEGKRLLMFSNNVESALAIQLLSQDWYYNAFL
jgi:hypothetical protein